MCIEEYLERCMKTCWQVFSSSNSMDNFCFSACSSAIFDFLQWTWIKNRKERKEGKKRGKRRRERQGGKEGRRKGRRKEGGASKQETVPSRPDRDGMSRTEGFGTGGRLTDLGCSVLAEEMLSQSPHAAWSPVPSEALVSVQGKRWPWPLLRPQASQVVPSVSQARSWVGRRGQGSVSLARPRGLYFY